MVIVESQKEWDEFYKDIQKQEAVVVPVQCDDNKHPLATNLCLLYFVGLDTTYEYILPFRHTDTKNLDIEKLNDLIIDQTIYTYDKKKLLHFAPFKDIKDLQMLTYLNTNEPLIIEDTITNAHEHFHRVNWGKPDLNCIIPILKHLEACRTVVNIIKKCVFYTQEKYYNDYNDRVLNNLQYIERRGLKTTNGMVYSEYNPYTATGRPSNRFGGLNFAALNKKDGSRKQFISRFGKDGMLVEMDYDAYHLRLIGDVIGYEFPEGSVHEHMAEFYGVDYDEAKGLSFQYLYGHIPDDVLKTNPFFNKVQKYIDNTWKSYKSNNFIESDIYNKKIYKKNLSNMNKNKVFNYLIQLLETESNMRMLTDLIPKVDEYRSEIILYNYDSFLFDFYVPDGLDFLYQMKKIIEQNGKFPVKVGKGWNYHEMNDITEKFVD